MIRHAMFEHKVSYFSHQVFGRSQSMPGTEALLTKPVEKQHTDTVVNFLIRIACQVQYINRRVVHNISCCYFT